MHPGSVQNHGNGLDPAMADHGIGLKAHFIGFPLASHPAAEGRAPCTSCACSSTAECRNIDFPHKATTKRLLEPSAPISMSGWSGGFYAAMRQTLVMGPDKAPRRTASLWAQNRLATGGVNPKGL